MSYEGYGEYICLSGHYVKARDIYDHPETECAICKSGMKYYHSVDVTNGYDETSAMSCDAPKIVIGSDDWWQTDHYDNRYAQRIHLYGIPEGMNPWIDLQSSES
ncbi:hypothetical protein EVB64_115 [Rhizobium phage RHph_TM61]|nr:hypothetical protein EVB64_115 [Rhizobium phage RHph_TM61]